MINADKVVKFLQESKIFYIATIDVDKPRVRPFGAAINIDGKVSICMGSFKDVYNQIEKNPYVEISAVNAANQWIRVSGKLVNLTNETNKKKFFDAFPMLTKIYSGETEKAFSIFSFASGMAVIQDMTGSKEILELK